jgi:hypothetical protein
MHGVVRRYTGGSDLADAMTKRSKEVQDLISGVPGFRHYIAVRSSDGVATVTICDDAAGTAESTRRAREWIQKNVPGATLSSLSTTEGDVFLDF